MHRYEHRDVSELFRRIAMMISYEIPKKEIREELLKEGWTEEQIYFAYKGAELIAEGGGEW